MKQKDNGYKNKIKKIKPTPMFKHVILEGKYEKGDMIYVHNKEGCRIATYEVV